MTSDKILELFAPAKVNYYLHVLDRRPDGYRNLGSLMGFLDIGDNIEIKQADEFAYTTLGTFAHHVPKDVEQDLGVQAARLFSQKTEKPLSVAINVEKNIPSGAGMGGGSSDAATILMGLNQWFGTELSEEDLCTMGLELGSELPVCLRQRLTLVSERGEAVVDSSEERTHPMLIIWPNIFCSTSKMFSKFKPATNHVGNDLTETASSIYPEIKQCLSIMKAQYGVQDVQMNGSGSSCFAIFDDFEKAEMAQKIILNQKPTWWVRVARPYSRPKS